jgi:hypothetical protein
MRTVFDGSLDKCLAFIRAEKEKDETMEFDLVQSDISSTLFYVKELDGWDLYTASF